MNALGLTIPVSSVYRYINQGYMSCSKIDLPRAVKFKPRKSNNDKEPHLTPKQKQDRTYDKFLEYCDAEDITSWVELDTVIGRPGGKALMTFIFTVCNFMFGLILDNKTTAEVTHAIEGLKDRLGRTGHSFGEIFPVILTDYAEEKTMPKFFSFAIEFFDNQRFFGIVFRVNPENRAAFS